MPGAREYLHRARRRPAEPVKRTCTAELLIREGARDSGCTREAVREAWRGLAAGLWRLLLAGYRVRLGPVGTLELIRSLPRAAGRDDTGEGISLRASVQGRFRPAQDLRRAYRDLHPRPGDDGELLLDHVEVTDDELDRLENYRCES
jgi:nucleoid DNA-binding protein